MLNQKLNKRGAIGATMTWIVATIIILFVIFLFVYASYAIAKEKEIINFKIGIQSTRYSSNKNYEQILLSLLKTETYGRTIKQYILDGDYDELEEKIEPMLKELPNPRQDSFILYIYENEELVKSIGGKEYSESQPSIVYLNKNKKVRLY